MTLRTVTEYVITDYDAVVQALKTNPKVVEVVTAVANNAARRHEMNEFGETVLALILAGL